jgi:glycosyltransferase involved in cell wall biosynthesis
MASKKTGVLMLLDQLNMGGTETHVMAVTRELLSKGISVVIAGRPGSIKHEFQALGCPVYTKFPRDKHSISKFLYRIVRNERIGIIHGHMSASGKFGASLSRKLKLPFVFSVHGTYYHLNSLRNILNHANVTVSVSLPVKRWVQQTGRSSVLIPNGIDINHFRYQRKDDLHKKQNLSTEGPLVVYAGRLAWEKARICKMLIEACKELRGGRFPSLQLAIAGNGVHYENIRNLANDSQADKDGYFISLLGQCEDMPAIYSAADCVVGTGRVALEAMACECPVIAAGSRGFCGLVEPSRYNEAWLQYFGDHDANEPNSKEHFVESLVRVLSSENHCLYWGQEGRKYVAKNFEISTQALKLMDIYRSLNPLL